MEIKPEDLTSPEQALDFVEKTGIDSLAVVITSPDDNQTVGVSFTVAATVNGPNPITAVEFYLDGDLKSTDTTALYSTIFSKVSDGNHEIRVKAYDDSGDSVEETIDIEVAPP